MRPQRCMMLPTLGRALPCPQCDCAAHDTDVERKVPRHHARVRPLLRQVIT